MKKELISILIPFYGNEDFLENTLDSVKSQTYDNLEIIIVNDCSLSKDKNNRDFLHIIKEYIQKNKKLITIRYFENEANMGTFETRRKCFMKSSGKYCFFMDNDDTLTPSCIEKLYTKAKETNADIVQGTASIIYKEGTPVEKIENTNIAVNRVHTGTLEGNDILDDWLCNGGHNTLPWAKLYSKEVLAFAFKNIPTVFGNMSDELMLYYFVSKAAKIYCGIEDCVYVYNISSGLSSRVQITDLKRWEKVCSASSTFTILYSSFDEYPPTPKQKAAIQYFCRRSLKSSIKQLRLSVAPDLYDKARQMLCDYWGESFVEKMEVEFDKNHGEVI